MLNQSDQIYNLLVELAGAPEEGWTREQFVHWFGTADHSKEFRFQGSLGFGGKFRRNDGRFYVTCYSEEETPERLATIKHTNEALSSFGRKNTLGRALALAYRNTVDPEFKLELDDWLTELGIEER